jgi:recombination DNA repair RAD52 pathway protein
MAFSVKQLRPLRCSFDCRHIRTREINGRELFYLEGWYAISEASGIFGFDGWSRETVESRCVLTRENRGTLRTAAAPASASANGTKQNPPSDHRLRRRVKSREESR